jgi:hypothetical protein
MAQHRLEKTKGSSDFLPPGWHRIVAVGLAGINMDSLTIKVSGGYSEHEADLIHLAREALAKRPRLVTYNGGPFDLSVLRHRAMVHRVDLLALYGGPNLKQWDRYLYRYGDAHLDLADALSGYGASPRMRLDEVAQLCGFDGKGDVTGADVLDLWLDEQHTTIRDYVQRDAVLTLRVALRYLLTQGRLAPDRERLALDALDRHLDGVPT